METIISNPGLQHLAEKVFLNSEVVNLKICAQINQSCKQILKHPIFCLRKFRSLSKTNRDNWIKVIQSVKNSDEGIAILSYLRWNLKKEVLVDLPCYSSPAVQDNFRKKIWEICNKLNKSTKGEISIGSYKFPILSLEDIEVVKILAPLLDNPNAPCKSGKTPIQEAAYNGHTEIVKILAPLTDNSNPPDQYGTTPIQEAAYNGRIEIIKFLAPLTNNPNAPDNSGKTPIYRAANHVFGHTEIVKFLAPLTDNPNAPQRSGNTPIHVAAMWGHTEIVQILAPLAHNPNAPGEYGHTPIYFAALRGHTEIVKNLASFTENPNAPNGEDRKTPSSVTRNTEIRRFLESFNTSKKRKMI